MFILLVKIVATTVFVLGFSILAERCSPRLAGILMGAPLGALISYFFIGQEAGSEYVVASTPFATAGMTGTLMFTYAYYRTSVWCSDWPPHWNAFLAALIGVTVFLAFIAIISGFAFNIISALTLVIPAIFLGTFIFRKIGDLTISVPTRLTLKLLFFRASGAALLVTLISSLATLLGSVWGGLLMAFPMTLLPTMIIIHLTYSKEHVHALLSAFPVGLGSVVIYIVVVGETFSRFGIAGGTITALTAAWAYLILLPIGFKIFRYVRN